MVGVKETCWSLPVSLCEKTHAVITTDVCHHALSIGQHWFLSNAVTLNADGFFRIGFRISADCKECVTFRFKCSGVTELVYSFYEGCKIAGGENIIPLNSNREISGPPSCMSIYTYPEINDYGSRLAREHSGRSGSPPGFVDINVPSLRELPYILKHGSQYVIEIESKDDLNHISYSLEWTECTTKSDPYI